MNDSIPLRQTELENHSYEYKLQPAGHGSAGQWIKCDDDAFVTVDP